MQLQDNNTTSKLALCSVFTVMAAVTGILESFLPLEFIISIPGVKLGIANIFTVMAFSVLGIKYAVSVAILRVILVFLFTGNPVSLAMSMSGAIFAFVITAIMIKFVYVLYTYISVSALSAVFHGIGQFLCAYFFVGRSVFYYLPALCFGCALTGIFTGTLMNITTPKVKKYFNYSHERI